MRISHKQKQMLAFIEDFVGENRYPPTLEEIRTGLNISSKSLVNHHLAALENAALLSRSPNKSRGIRLAGENDLIRVPFLTAEADQVREPKAEIDVEAVIALTNDIVPYRDDLYALQVQDDSMIDALVNQGDVVILQKKDHAENGDMIAARLAGQPATLLKRYYRDAKRGHVRLESAHPNLRPIIAHPEMVKIQGKVVAVIRQID